MGLNLILGEPHYPTIDFMDSERACIHKSIWEVEVKPEQDQRDPNILAC